MPGRRASESRCSTERASAAEGGLLQSQGPSVPLALNVGCGSAYKPGFINIDMDRSSSADLIADALHLPIRDGAVDRIEADQFLEHFDTAHVRVVLWEFHRVLCPEGELAIETPDIHKSVKRLVSEEPGRQSAELQWIYGLDSPGLQHRTGFTKDSLKHLLDESSFQVVRFEKAATHRYEPGMRVLSRRREPLSSRWCALSRAVQVLTRDHMFDDSFVLVPLQEELARIGGLAEEDDELIAKACVLNPEVALAVESCLQGARPAEPGSRVELIESLRGKRFHERAFTLWKKSARKNGELGEFLEFTDRLARDVMACIHVDPGGTDRLRYVLNLEPTPIQLLEYRLVAYEGQRALGRGIKMYSSSRRDQARELFKEALAIHPGDFHAAMNLARVLANIGSNAADVRDAYERALDSAPAHLRGVAKNEFSEYMNTGKSPDTPFVPP